MNKMNRWLTYLWSLLMLAMPQMLQADWKANLATAIANSYVVPAGSDTPILWCVNRSGETWYKIGSANWVQLTAGTGKLQAIACGPQGQVYAIDTNYTLWALQGITQSTPQGNGQAWKSFGTPPGKKLFQLSVGPTLVWALATDSTIWYLNPNNGTWVLDAAGGKALRISVSPEGNTILVLGIGGKGINPPFYRTNASNGVGDGWASFSVPGSNGQYSISVGPQGFMTATAQPFMKTNWLGFVRGGIGGDWVSIGGSPRDIGIGANRQMYCIGADGNIWGWTVWGDWGGDHWTKLPGTGSFAVSLAVGPDLAALPK